MQNEVVPPAFLERSGCFFHHFQLFFYPVRAQDPADIARILEVPANQQTQPKKIFYYYYYYKMNGTQGKNLPHPLVTPLSHNEQPKRVRQIVRPDECTCSFATRSSASEYGLNNATASVYFPPLFSTRSRLLKHDNVWEPFHRL